MKLFLSTKGISSKIAIFSLIGVIAITAVVLWLFLTKANDTFVPEVITYNNHVFTSLEDGKWLLTLQDLQHRREYDIPLYYTQYSGCFW